MLNYLFVDGHVKALKPTATASNGVINMWNIYVLSNKGVGTALTNYLATSERNLQ